MRSRRPLILLPFAAGCCLLLASLAAAQPPAGGPPPGGPPFGGPGGFFGGGGIAGLLQTPEVQREVELSDDQKAELGKLRNEIGDQIRNQMRDSFSGMRDMNDEERAARFEQIRTQMDTIRKNVEAKLQKVLLPNQFDRLKQIDLQSRVQREGATALTSTELADQLGLSDDQKEQIEQKAAQVQQDLQAKIRQARVDARNQLLDVLTPDQRTKLEAMMGSQFDLPEPGPTPQFGNRGPGGGRQGRNGRGGRGARNSNGSTTPTTPSTTPTTPTTQSETN